MNYSTELESVSLHLWAVLEINSLVGCVITMLVTDTASLHDSYMLRPGYTVVNSYGFLVCSHDSWQWYSSRQLC
ncbi:MAG: hypothetical protein ACFBSF_20985 [Leptolyngbyaceae cyanobacterium]